MDNAIKQAIANKRSKASMDPAFNADKHGEHLDEKDHADLAPDADDSATHEVNPTRPDKAGFSSKPVPENARAGEDEHIYPQEDLTDPTKQPRKFNDKNVGRMMSGDGTDPQHDREGVDLDAKDLKIDSPSNQANHAASESMTHKVAGLVGDKLGVPELKTGDYPDGKGSDAMRTAKLQSKNIAGQSPKLRGGLEQGANDNNRFAHKPMAGARAKISSKY